jgi:hypothetical protein
VIYGVGVILTTSSVVNWTLSASRGWVCRKEVALFLITAVRTLIKHLRQDTIFFWLFFRCFVTLSRSSIVTQRCENESLRRKIAPNFFQPDVFVKPVTVLNVKQVLFRHDTHYSFVSCVAVCITAVWKKKQSKTAVSCIFVMCTNRLKNFSLRHSQVPSFQSLPVYILGLQKINI